jgi:cytochrome oxidase assembly protein ShyY1
MKRFEPGLLPTLVVLALLPVLVSFGCWQLDRGAQKRAMLASYTERRSETVISIDQLLNSRDTEYRRVEMVGRFDGEHSVLLDNSTRAGAAGVELIQPFQDQASGVWAWVNRGWLPWPDRRIPPVFSTPVQVLTIQAWVYRLPAAFQLKADLADAAWPRLVTAVEPEKLWAELGREGFSQELRLDSALGAYRLEWPIVAMDPEKHRAYAVQWFSMAAALFGLYLYLGWHQAKSKKKTKKKPEDDHGDNHQPSQHV